MRASETATRQSRRRRRVRCQTVPQWTCAIDMPHCCAVPRRSWRTRKFDGAPKPLCHKACSGPCATPFYLASLLSFALNKRSKIKGWVPRIVQTQPAQRIPRNRVAECGSASATNRAAMRIIAEPPDCDDAAPPSQRQPGNPHQIKAAGSVGSQRSPLAATLAATATTCRAIKKGRCSPLLAAIKDNGMDAPSLTGT